MNANTAVLDSGELPFVPMMRTGAPDEVGLPHLPPSDEKILAHFYTDQKLNLKVTDFSRIEFRRYDSRLERKLRLVGNDPEMLEVTPVREGEDMKPFSLRRLDDWHYYMEGEACDGFVWRCLD